MYFSGKIRNQKIYNFACANTFSFNWRSKNLICPKHPQFVLSFPNTFRAPYIPWDRWLHRSFVKKKFVSNFGVKLHFFPFIINFRTRPTRQELGFIRWGLWVLLYEIPKISFYKTVIGFGHSILPVIIKWIDNFYIWILYYENTVHPCFHKYERHFIRWHQVYTDQRWVGNFIS